MVAKVCDLVSNLAKLEIDITVGRHVDHLQKHTSSVDSGSPEKQKALSLSIRQLTMRVHQQFCQHQLRLVPLENQGHSQLSV